MVAWHNGEVVSVPLELVISQSPALVVPQSGLIQTAQSIGVYVGES
jgi:6-phosphofructokinase 1